MVNQHPDSHSLINSAVVVVTADGSGTLFNESTGEHYHSMGGALTESRHVYIDQGLLPVLALNDFIHVYEAGMGTGLNALLTSLEARKNRKFIHYHACDLFPVPLEVTGMLNYPELIGDEFASSDFRSIHSQSWDTGPQRIHQYFILSKYRRNFIRMNFFEEQLRLVYFDAFSSHSQPELWRFELFSTLAGSMLPGGVLVTYAAAGIVKEALRKAGFRVKRLQGVAGKREMLRATKV